MRFYIVLCGIKYGCEYLFINANEKAMMIHSYSSQENKHKNYLYFYWDYMVLKILYWTSKVMATFTSKSWYYI